MREKIFSKLVSTLVIFFLFAVPLSCIYVPTLDFAWHFDDHHNILDNKNVHLERLDFESISRSFFKHDTKMPLGIYRPVSMLSFAVNWFFGADDVWGYRLVNIFIHILCSVFLYFFIKLILSTPKIPDSISVNKVPISFLATLLWAINPVQTQSVVYIVQRMTGLSALFAVASLSGYLCFRLSHTTDRKKFFLLVSLVMFVLSILSKENSVFLPFSIVAIEVTLFRSQSWFRSSFFKITIGLSFAIVVSLSSWFYFSGLMDFIYVMRPFTLLERMMTEWRILFHYLYLIFYPHPDHFSIVKNIPVSQSLLSPLTTLLSLLGIVALLVFAFKKRKQIPLLSLAILFFFLNHIVESTVLPLELYFEHRNYLPSMLLFLPFSSFIVTYGLRRNIFPKVVVLCSVLSLCVIFSYFTYVRNKAWENEYTLWTDVLRKVPDDARPYLALAKWLQDNGHYDKALELYDKALPLDHQSSVIKNDILHLNRASIYISRYEYDKALVECQKVLDFERSDENLGHVMNINVRRVMAVAYIGLGKFKIALSILNEQERLVPNNIDVLNSKALCFFYLQDYEQAIYYSRLALQINHTNQRCLLLLSRSYQEIGDSFKAMFFARLATIYHPNSSNCHLYVYQLLLLQNDNNAEKYLSKIDAMFSREILSSVLDREGKYGYLSYLNADFIKAKFDEK
jgi:tetratricopeptide (TPR) repeat protein